MDQNRNDIFVSPDVIEKVASKRIYFAHMSVGYNILEGVSLLTGNLNPIELGDTTLPDGPGFFHSRIGKNTDPLSKINDFHSKMTGGIGNIIDIAFLKFCYVDFDENTDVTEVFDAYRKTVDELEALYPDITLVHLTVPLTRRQGGVKAGIKRILGMGVYGEKENLKRQEYNEMIRNNYSRVFDLAAVESTKPDGSRCEHTLDGATYYSLCPEYTTDGGHLNQLGSKLVAQKLLLFLSNVE